jgi:hypothetical protein
VNVGSVFSGCGLLDYGLHLAGFEHAWFCEADEYRRSIIGLRYPGVPVYDDIIRTLTGAELAQVDLVAGGFRNVADEVAPDAADAEREPSGSAPGEVPSAPGTGEGEGPERQRLRPDARDGGSTPADAASGCGADESAGSYREAQPIGAVARAGSGDRDGPHAERDRIVGGGSEVVEVGWGEYELAVRRWEAILGRPSPQPLVHRVDDGRTRRVERSRLSALGDGVLVQAGWLVGRRIVEFEAERVRAAA